MPVTMRKFTPILMIVFLAVFCVACIPVRTSTTSTKPGTGATSSPEETLAAAETAYGRGQYQAAADYYKRYLAVVPNPAKLESILASYGLAAENSGLYGDAVLAFERLQRDFPGGSFAREAGPHLAASYMGAGQLAKAESFGRELLGKETDPGLQNQLRLTVGQSQWLQGRYQLAAGSFLAAWQKSAGQTKAAAEEGLLASLARMTPTALGDIQKSYGQNFPGPEATYALIHKALEAGDTTGAAAHAEYFSRYFSSHSLMPKVTELASLAAGASLPPLVFGGSYDPRPKAIAGTSSSGGGQAVVGSLSGLSGRYTIAAVLPVSDSGASRYAQEVINGLKLALSQAGNKGSVGLTVLDSRGSGDEASNLVNQAAADGNVMVVVGPLLSREVLPAAQTAEKAGLPMITISQRMDLTGIGPNIFRIFLTPKHQAESVARYAVKVQGHQALGVLAPSDSLGRSMRTYFENEVRRQGGAVTVADTYDPKSGDWGKAVERLTGGKVARKVSASYQANTGFTALYMPDAAASIAQIVPLMAFHDVTKMQYLGSPLWLNSELLTGGSARYIQGAVIPVALSELSQRPETKNFISAYQSAYGQVPDQFAAYGYDAGLAVVNALGSGASSRAEVRRILGQSLGIPGATGPFGFDNNGDFLVEPTLLTIENQSFILLRDAASAVR
ncbi:hypothetical protein C4J81_08695 [Deltaproteobacteria bacterium Smac51]|nr:hypothetical protein C4J81_08695 [Deltaproteobacteria bacterium Smac51]